MSDENSIVHRIALLDILRGFALIGILFPNIFAVADIRWLESPEDQWIRDSWAYFFKGRFFPIFSLLFGIGFFLFTENAERKGLPAKRLLKRRLWLLLLLGIPHQFFHPGEALLYYAIFGFLLFPLGGLSQRVQLLITVLLLIGGGLTTSAFLTPGLLSLGALLGSIGYFPNLEKFCRSTRIAWMVSLALAGPLCYLQFIESENRNTLMFRSLAGLAIATFSVTSLILLPRVEQILKPLAAFGRLALTNYILQTVIILCIDLNHPVTSSNVWIV